MFNILFTTTSFICIVLLLRFLCKKHISARLQYAIWLFVAVKLLVFPVPNVEGEFSVLGLVEQGRQEGISREETSAEEPVGSQTGGMAQGEADSGQKSHGTLWAAEGQGAGGSNVAGTDTGVTPQYLGDDGRGVTGLRSRYQMTKLRLLHGVETVLKVPVWSVGVLAAGSLVCALWMAAYYVRVGRYLRRRRVAVPDFRTEGSEILSAGARRLFRIYSVEGLPTPCLFGRSIYVPANVAENRELLPYVLRHEMCHYFHGDPVWSAVRMICVCLYWYHPLVWVAAYLSGQDCELACDEAAVKSMGGQERRQYGELLLKFVPVKAFPADCLLMTTAMSGNAENLRQRLERITGKRKNRVALGVLAVAAGLAGIYACVTNGFISVDKQWQSIRIRREEGSVPVLQESYKLDYRLSKDAASYGLYLEQYEYGELIAAEILDCETLQPEGEASRKEKTGEVLYERRLESDEETGAFVKSVNSYSVPDHAVSDGAGSSFKAFTLDLSEVTAFGSSFSVVAEERLEHRFRIGDDIILLASYYGDGRLSVPWDHFFEADRYMEENGDILKSDSCVILVHLIVSDKDSKELRGQIDEIVRKKAEGNAAEEDLRSEMTETEAEDGGGYSNEELQEMAKNYFLDKYGFMPANAEIDREKGNEVRIWLWDNKDTFLSGTGEIVVNDRTEDWYTVDRLTGKGKNVLSEEIDLTQAASLTRPWNGNMEEMTVEDVREEELFFALPAKPEAGTGDMLCLLDEIEHYKLYLLGETEHYRLYGTGDYQSMLLEDQDSMTEISVPFITDGITLLAPDMQEADYDGDGTAELAVRLLRGKGTGVWQEQLWMIDKEEGRIKACEYSSGVYAEELLRRLSFAESESGKVITLGGRQISPELRQEQDVSYEETRINTSIVSFAFADGTIKLRTLISCGSREGSVMPAYGDSCLEAEILYDGNRFFIRDVASADLKDVERIAEEAVRDYYAPRGIEIIDYNAGKWRLEEGKENMEMTLTVLEKGDDSYDFATVPFVREETGQWAVAGEIWLEK